MEKRFENKNVLVTGCNRGIGKVILETFCKEGANIVACTRKVDQELVSLYDNLKNQYGIKIFPVQVELSNPESIQNAIKDIFALKIPIHVLVNNAGIACFDGLMKLSQQQLEKVFQVNYFGPLMMIKGLIMPMMKSGGASIINMVSVAGMDGSEGNCAYGASKAAMILATKTLANELVKAKIRVNAIAPSVVKTDMSDGIDEHIISNIVQETAIGRIATPEEIANVVLFLASENATYINGQVIRVDGGLK